MNDRFREKQASGDQRERLNLNLHIILIARPRYQYLAIHARQTKKPRLDDFFCVSDRIQENGSAYVLDYEDYH